ncbi:MAG TPA: beta-ketoacyl-ACP reductase [Tissierellia bacterium]|nr:beta-ketoacyl-ACP reductase [Tissierellia bacterium]
MSITQLPWRRPCREWSLSRVAVVTGASRGIGAAIAKRLSEAGYELALVASSPWLEAPVYSSRVVTYQADVSDYEAVKAMVARIKADFGRIDVLINNAGITRDGLILQMAEADYDRVMDINLKGQFNLIRHISPIMLRQKSGRIINISSVAGLIGNAGQTNYATAKAGTIGLTKSVARELAPRGITCNAIAPGFIETDMTKDLEVPLQQMIPLGVSGQPEDIAATAVFLASEGARYITGEVIRVDGGMGM